MCSAVSTLYDGFIFHFYTSSMFPPQDDKIIKSCYHVLSFYATIIIMKIQCSFPSSNSSAPIWQSTICKHFPFLLDLLNLPRYIYNFKLNVKLLKLIWVQIWRSLNVILGAVKKIIWISKHGWPFFFFCMGNNWFFSYGVLISTLLIYGSENPSEL